MMATNIVDIKQNIKKSIEEILPSLGIKNGFPVNLVFPQDIRHGDYTSNIALTIAKPLNRNPMEIGAEIISVLRDKLPMMGKIELVKPGFLNLYFSDNFLITQISVMLKMRENVGKNTKLAGKKIMVEFTDPNPFKEFHIGHLYSNIVGEALSRLFESQGALVQRVCYQGDVGLHVAKAIWGMRHLFNEIPKDTSTLNDRANFMGRAYSLGASAFEENPVAKNEIIEINKKIYSREDLQIIELYSKGKQWSLEYFAKIYSRLGTHFSKFYFESQVGQIGLELVKKHVKDGIFEEHDNAVIFRGEKYGLHTRVFINSQGLPTYEAKELGLAPTKYNDFQYDESIIITANEIKEYFKVLLKVLSLINPELAKKTKHISHGMVKLPSGKMSSRKGNILTGEWLLDEATKRSKDKIQEAKHTGEIFEQQNQEVIADQVGVGAVKYALLKTSIGKDVEFDFDKSVTFEGNAGPYLQYTYVRTQSLLQKSTTSFETLDNYTLEVIESDLLRLCLQFCSIVETSADTISPNTICDYLYDLAKHFNLFYQKYRIIDAATSVQGNFRLALTALVGIILHQGLGFLGIAAPKKM